MAISRNIYLAGPITGLSYAQAKKGWREEFVDYVNATDVGNGASLYMLSPMRGKEKFSDIKKFVQSPDELSAFPLATPRGTMTRDFLDITRADIIVAGLHLPTKVASVGTCVELGYAKSLGKPIVIIGTEVGPHSHMWLKEIANFWVKDVREAGDVVGGLLSYGL